MMSEGTSQGGGQDGEFSPLAIANTSPTISAAQLDPCHDMAGPSCVICQKGHCQVNGSRPREQQAVSGGGHNDSLGEDRAQAAKVTLLNGHVQAFGQ